MRLPRGSDFRPSWPFTNGHVQTLFSPGAFSGYTFSRTSCELIQRAEKVVLDAGHGVRLSGAFTAQKLRPQARGLAVLFHGWEGSVDSSYVVRTGNRLLGEDWDVLRLNFRDHGGSHALNEGLFHSCRMDEVVHALGAIAARWPTRPIALAGFSLGGNFALRAAMHQACAGISLSYVLAVCPVIDPASGLFALERRAHGLYQAYFLREWRKSLRVKQASFPQHVYFRPAELEQSLIDITESLVHRHTHFPSLQAYLQGYALTGSAMQLMTIPATILTARDDPMIPVKAFEELDLPANVELDIAPYGGHCSFMHGFNMKSFTDDYIAERFNALSDGRLSAWLAARP